MGIIKRMRKQTAVYWPLDAVDRYGQPQLGSPVELTVRWEDKKELFRNLDGEEVMSAAVVYVPEVSDGVEVKEGDYLWLGSLGDAPADPIANKKAFQVRKFDKLPDLRAREFLRTAYL